MKNKSLASFIIVNYNGEKYLPRLIKSILSQSTKSSEIIMVDNQSTDNSVDLVKQQFPTVKIVLSSNIGYGRGCNLGAKYSSGNYLIFLNPDTYLHVDYLKNITKSYQEKKQQSSNRLGCFNCKVAEFDTNPQKAPHLQGSLIDLFGNPRQTNKPDRVNDSFLVFGTGLFIEKSIFNKIGKFNPNFFLYGEEVDLCWRLKTQGYLIMVTNDALLFHQGSGSFGDNRPHQIALMLYGSFLCSLTNYQTMSLFLLLPIYLIYLILIGILLPFTRKLNFKYTQELLKVFGGLFKNYQKIFRFRQQVQKQRCQSDWQLRKYFSLIPSIIYRSIATSNILQSNPGSLSKVLK